MRKATPAVAFLALALAAGAGMLVSAGPEHVEVTIEGEILDMACYMAHEATGPKHAACALKCIREGQPVGLLAGDGRVYLLYAGHGDAAPYETARELAGKSVVITGKRITRGGVDAIQVLSVEPS